MKDSWIVKQPNGKYAVWSTVYNDFDLIEATFDELIDFFMEQYRGQAIHDVTTLMEYADKNTKYMNHVPASWEEAVLARKATHGKRPGFVEDPLKDPSFEGDR